MLWLDFTIPFAKRNYENSRLLRKLHHSRIFGGRALMSKNHEEESGRREKTENERSRKPDSILL